MNASLVRVMLTAAGILVLAPAPAAAAAFRTAYAVCQDKDLFKQAFQNPKDPAGARAAAFLKGKVESGACLQFGKGQQVTIDERDGALWCVRRTGDLDCFWTIDKAVDPNPPLASSSGGARGSGGRRSGRGAQNPQ
jgi:hypothetical protein